MAIGFNQVHAKRTAPRRAPRRAAVQSRRSVSRRLFLLLSVSSGEGAAGQWQSPLLSHAAWRSSGGNSGRIAQLVEQLTLNQRVPGSSPGAPTNQPIEIESEFLE